MSFQFYVTPSANPPTAVPSVAAWAPQHIQPLPPPPVHPVGGTAFVPEESEFVNDTIPPADFYPQHIQPWVERRTIPWLYGRWTIDPPTLNEPGEDATIAPSMTWEVRPVRPVFRAAAYSPAFSLAWTAEPPASADRGAIEARVFFMPRYTERTKLAPRYVYGIKIGPKDRN